MDLPQSDFDAQELFHLALSCSEQGDHDKAIAYLKEILKQVDDANTHYLLGAEYAEIKLYDRAVQEIEAAVELNPELWTAHYQLGLVHVTKGDASSAVSSWQALDALADSQHKWHYLYCFKMGMSALFEENSFEAADWLQRGIDSNEDNLPLNRDMQRIIDDLSTAVSAASNGETGADQSQDDTDANTFLLSKYGKH